LTFDLRYPIIILFLLSACSTLATATTYGVDTTTILIPQDSILVVKSICITGNKKTKEKILIRELPVKVGDQIYHSTLDSMLERCKQQLVNLGLFNVVRVTHTQHEGESEINIFVIERWYSWPIPIFQIADRNFNQWWIEKDLQRINYGIELAQFNLRGRNETLRLKIQNGFTRKVEATYTFPWIDRKQRLGLSFKVTYLGNREVWHTTVNNKLDIYRDNDRDMLNRFTTGLILKIRPRFF
jgi:outer membrane protein assembly factor BamA